MARFLEGVPFWPPFSLLESMMIDCCLVGVDCDEVVAQC